MKFVQKLKIERNVQKLKSARSLSRTELESLQDELVGVGATAIEPMLRCLGHAEARPSAMVILGRLLDDSTVGLYMQALASPNPAIVSGVTQVLAGSSGYRPGVLLPFLADAATPRSALATVLEARAHSIRPREILSIFHELDKEARTTLFQILDKTLTVQNAGGLVSLCRHKDWTIRLRAVELLGRFGDPAVVRALTDRLQDENRNIRLAAVKGLHGLRARDAIPPLAQSLRDSDLKVQTAAIDALTGFADVSAVPHLLEVLTDESEQARRGAVEVLNEVATTEAIQDLLRALHDADWWVRVRAADALGSLGGPRVVEAVLGLLKDPEEFIRRYAVEILNTLPDARAVEPLIRSLDDPDWWVRERSIDALGMTKDPRALEPLVALMRRDNDAVPLCARALGELGDPRAIEFLRQLVNSERADVSREAKASLRRLEQPAHGANASTAHEGSRGHGGSGSTKLVPFRIEPKGAAAEHLGEAKPESGQKGAAASPADPAALPSPQGAPILEAPPTPVPVALNYADLPAGTGLLERYRVLRRIGTGGFGTVYLVQDTAVQEQLILKILNPQLSVDANSIRRFVQELKLTRRVTHRNVIRIYDFLDLNGAHAVSMEYFPSRDLGHILQMEKIIDPARSLRLTHQICEGLGAAHMEGVIHRDIKPANILVGNSDNVKIVDFGLAAAQQQSGSRLTRSGLLIGTPEYMAPELIQGDKVDHRADLYSLGIMMYEMLSGRRPYGAETPVKILFQHLEGNALPLRQLVPTLPPSLEALVVRLMSKDAEARPRDVNETMNLVNAELALLGVAREKT